MVLGAKDRHLLAKTVYGVYSIQKGQFVEFGGDLADYERWRARYNELEASPQAAQSNQVADNSAADKKAQRQQAAALREQLAPLRKQVKALENQMDKLQTRLDKLESELGDEAIYAEQNKAKLAELVKEQGSVKAELGLVEEQWLEYQEALEAAL